MDTSRRKGPKRISKKKNNGGSTLLQWLKPSFEYRGRASSRKLTVFISYSLLIAGFIVHLYTGQFIQPEYIIVLSTITLLGLGFLTVENIVQLVRARFNQQNMFIDYEQDIYNKRAKPDNPDGLQQEAGNGG